MNDEKINSAKPLKQQQEEDDEEEEGGGGCAGASPFTHMFLLRNALIFAPRW